MCVFFYFTMHKLHMRLNVGGTASLYKRVVHVEHQSHRVRAQAD